MWEILVTKVPANADPRTLVALLGWTHSEARAFLDAVPAAFMPSSVGRIKPILRYLHKARWQVHARVSAESSDPVYDLMWRDVTWASAT